MVDFTVPRFTKPTFLISVLTDFKSHNGDQQQISPNTDAYLTPDFMRIKDMITQGEFS